MDVVVAGSARSTEVKRLSAAIAEYVRVLVLTTWIGSPLVPRPLRWRLLRACGADVERSSISPYVFIGSPDVHIGPGVFINAGCLLDTFAGVRIEAGCSLGMQVTIATSTHAMGGSERRAGRLTGAPVTIGAGTWVGARAVILPGVTVGPGCVIAAGAVVVTDCEPDGLYAGVPARRIRDLGGTVSMSAPASSGSRP